MTAYHFHLRLPARTEWDRVGVPFASLEEAFLSVCATIPTMAGELLREGHDLARCAYLISDGRGQVLLEVPFSELQRSPALPGIRRHAQQFAAVQRHLERSREVVALARQQSASARLSLLRCQAVVSEMRRRGEERCRSASAR